jgi:hypothetical protein
VKERGRGTPENPFAFPKDSAEGVHVSWWRRISIVPVSMFAGWLMYVVCVAVMHKLGLHGSVLADFFETGIPGVIAGNVAARIGRPLWLWPSGATGMALFGTLYLLRLANHPDQVTSILEIPIGSAAALLGGYLAHLDR